MNKNAIKDLTIGALFGAIYGVFYILIQTVFVSTDSFIYYILPLPIAIYTSWKGYKKGLLVLAVSIALEFIIELNGLFLYYALLITPCLLVGFLYGVLKGKTSNFVTIIITFIMALIANFISLYAFELINNISYYQMTESELSPLVSGFNIDPQIITNIIWVSIPVVFVVDSVVKVLFLEILFIIFMRRLKLDNEVNLSIKFRLSPWYSIIEIVSFIFMAFVYYEFIFNSGDLFYQIAFIISLSLFLSFSFYMDMMAILYLGRNSSKGIKILLSILGILFMPIFVIISVVVNFIPQSSLQK